MLSAEPDAHARPALESHGAYVVGRFLDAGPAGAERRIAYREVSFVATPELLVTVRRTPASGSAWDPTALQASAEAGAPVGELLFRLVDDVSQSFLDAVDEWDDEIDELEEHIDDWSSEQVRRRLVDLRHDLHRARRTASATRATVRRIVDKRLDIGADTLFPERIERLFMEPYETLLRTSEELDGARDVLAALRDHHQARIAEAQSDIVKKLTVIASLVLVPTLIVGFYGQNFGPDFDEPYWTLGTSTGLIVLTTAIQLAIYRWRRWI